jgi:hypothetical protein
MKVDNDKSSPPVFLIHPPSIVNPNKALPDVPLSSEDSASTKLESGEFREVWDGYEKDVLPDKLEWKVVRNLRHGFFSLYRRLFGVVFVTNMAIFIALLVEGANAQRLGMITLANLFVAMCVRGFSSSAPSNPCGAVLCGKTT